MLICVHAHFCKTVYLNNTMMSYVASVFLALLGTALAGQHLQNDVCPHFSITDSDSNKCYQILPLTPSPYFDGPALCGENGGTLSTDVLDCDGKNEGRMCDVVKSLCQYNDIVSFNETVVGRRGHHGHRHHHHHQGPHQEVWYQCGNSRFVLCELAKSNSVMDQLWAESQTEVSQVLKTDMIQGLIDGSLDPQQFAAFLVNNVYYISRGPKTYLNALSRTSDRNGRLAKALEERHADFEKYNQEFYQSLNIDPQAVTIRGGFVVPTAGSHIREYTDFSKNVSESQDPYLTVVVNTPCSYLWCWLGTILPNFATNIGMNVYTETIGNLFGKELNARQCATDIVSYVNTLAKESGVDLAKTITVFRRAMAYEVENFNSTMSSHWV